MPPPEGSEQPFFNPKSKDATLGSIFTRLDNQDRILETHSEAFVDLSDSVNDLKTYVKAAAAVGGCLLLAAGLLGWLLSNQYIRFQSPYSQIQILNATKP